MLPAVRPKTRRAKRALEARAPKLNENQKKALLLHGTKTSAVIKEALGDLHHLKKWGGNSIKLSRKNENILPFEAGGESSLEFIAQKADCSLFAYATHSKKRPNNLILGRMFDFHIFDMVEVGINRYKSVKDLKGGGKLAPQVGSKPCFAFIGQDFDTNPVLGQLRNTLLDFFRGEVVETINLAGLDRVYVCVASGHKVFIRHCAIRLKKSGTRIPRVELVEVGPSFDLVLRRSRGPAEDVKKQALKTGASVQQKKVKNVQSSEVEGKTGRVYMPKQNVGGMALRKMKGLKRERREEAAARKRKGKTSEPGAENASAMSKRQRPDDEE